MRPDAPAIRSLRGRLRLFGAAIAMLPSLDGCGGSGGSGLPACGPGCIGGEAPATYPLSIAVADVNGDGVPDLLVATESVDQNGVYRGLADVILGIGKPPASFAPGVPYYTLGTNPSGIAVTDLTGSGSLDLVVSDYDGSIAVLLHGAAAGTFEAPITVATGGQPNQLVAGDLTASGAKRDLAIANDIAAGQVIVLVHDAANPGRFQAPLLLPAGNFTTSLAIGSLGNGTTVIVATASDVTDDNGVVEIFTETSTSPVAFSAPVSFPAGSQPTRVKIADVNGDGLPDLIVANYGPGSGGAGEAGVSVLLQDAAHPGSFLAPVTYAVPYGAEDVAVADLDGDGRPDLVVASIAPSAMNLPNGAVSVLLQNPAPAAAGAFGAPTVYPGVSSPTSVAIADLNGDGFPDIAVADGPAATILLQDPGARGTFAPPIGVGY